MEMGRIKKPLGTAIDPDLSDRIDQWVKANPPWRKVDVIEASLEMFLREKGTEAATRSGKE